MRNTLVIRVLLFALTLLAIPATAPTASAAFGFGISITLAPPPLPVYDQPICPGDGYIWTPGYWAYGPDGYFWVPGTWVLAPRIGFLWTPGYWGWGGSGYFWHAGYWGPHVGFYGGINYGFGYGGFGYQGGYWNGSHFYYNRGVNNVNVTNIHNTYNRTVINNNSANRVSFNGGRGGVNARPTPAEMAANRDQHIGATGMQSQQEHFASNNRAQFAAVNHGQPATAATARPGEFPSRGATASNNFNRGSNFVRPNTSNAARGSNGSMQARTTQRENAVSRSPNNSTRMQQNNARSPNARSFNSRPSDSRQFNSRSSNARSSNSARQPSSPAFRQNTSRPATRSNPAPQQSRSARPAAPSQSRGSSGPHGNASPAPKSSAGGSHGGNGGKHNGR